MSSDLLLKIILRVLGTSSLTAVAFIFVPSAWMSSIHASVGLGEMPDAPVVWYLARSTSTFYAIVGGLFWTVSFDLVRHRTVLVYLSWAILFLGLTLLGIDWTEGMPLFWKLWEGPYVILAGLAMIWSARRIPSS